MEKKGRSQPLSLQASDLQFSRARWTGERAKPQTLTMENKSSSLLYGLQSGCPHGIQTQSRQKSGGNDACLVLPQEKMNCCMSQGKDAEVGRDGKLNMEVDSTVMNW